MKMNDVWPHVDFTYGKFQKTVDEFGEVTTDDEVECLCGLVFSNEEPAKATMYAIKNHDRLTSENARLREALRALLYSDIYADAEGCYEISKEDTDEVTAAKQLLTELEKGDE